MPRFSPSVGCIRASLRLKSSLLSGRTMHKSAWEGLLRHPSIHALRSAMSGDILGDILGDKDLYMHSRVRRAPFLLSFSSSISSPTQQSLSTCRSHSIPAPPLSRQCRSRYVPSLCDSATIYSTNIPPPYASQPDLMCHLAPSVALRRRASRTLLRAASCPPWAPAAPWLMCTFPRKTPLQLR